VYTKVIRLKHLCVISVVYLLALSCSACSVRQSNPLEMGRVLRRTLQSDSEQEYFLYLPRRSATSCRLVISVHGISRNAEEHAVLFAPFAENYGAILVAPLFSDTRFHGYQRLFSEDPERRADKVLDRIVSEVRGLAGNCPDKLNLFGYSGGAQFVHRYTMIHPERVAKVVVGAAGWYTFPDSSRSYPTGIGHNPKMPDIDPDPDRFLRVPAYVIVGERDLRHDVALNDSDRLSRYEGETRMERGRRWIKSMSDAARAIGLNTDYQFFTVPRSRHSFRQCMKRGGMGELTFRLLFGD